MLIGEENPELVKKLADKFMALYDGGVAENTFFYEDVAEMLDSLKQQGCELYIATNKRYKPTEAILKQLGFYDMFADVRAVDQLPENNRSKAILIEQILDKFNIAIEDAVYVGDKLDDFKAADANKVKFLAASWGYGEWDKLFTILDKPLDLIEANKS
jgi:phosphoglycolate phosphatase